MSKEQKNRRAQARRANGNRNNQETRRDRWHRHVSSRLAEIDGNRNFIPAKWLEEIEGRPMADVICDWLADNRGFGVKRPTDIQKEFLETDEWYERNETKRRRDNHERKSACQAVFSFLNPRGFTFLHDEETHEVVRRFYRAGDYGMYATICRAIRHAINCAQKSEVA